MIRSFRLQLTAWYLLLFAVLFVGFSLFLYGLLARGLYQRLDETLSSEARTAAGLFQDELHEHQGDAPAAAAEAISEMNFRGALLAVFERNKLLAGSAAHWLTASMYSSEKLMYILSAFFPSPGIEPLMPTVFG